MNEWSGEDLNHDSLSSLENVFQAGKNSELLNIAGVSSHMQTKTFGFRNMAIGSDPVQSNCEKEAEAGWIWDKPYSLGNAGAELRMCVQEEDFPWEEERSVLRGSGEWPSRVSRLREHRESKDLEKVRKDCRFLYASHCITKYQCSLVSFINIHAWLYGQNSKMTISRLDQFPEFRIHRTYYSLDICPMSTSN